ncbi:MAG: ATP-binding cassette domain-containing protein [Bacteroidetes bacterium]|nr:MAG: ATP-binding cassette domain-containing protein [Bacteroidota bacterium]
MDKEKVIEVSNLAASFGDTVVLSDVSFSAYKGEVTIILGSSGSGKSTVLKHLLGLYPVLKGRVKVLGRDISRLTEKEQLELYMQMGVFYQNGALLNSMTVGENVALPLKQHTTLPDSLVEDIVNMKLGLVNLGHAKNLFPSELSGGMLKRAALARAIALDAPVLFFDEPGAGLDPISLESLDQLIVNLKEQLGMSIIMVTHEVSSILRIANRVVYLDKGNVAFEGTLKEALQCNVESVRQFFSLIDDVDKVKQA